MRPVALLALFIVCCTDVGAGARADTPDPRIWQVRYEAGSVLLLTGYIGYHIDFEFAPGEMFVNLGAGDIGALEVGAEGNHLFLKPKAVTPGTNVTIVTNRRVYYLDYRSQRLRSGEPNADVVYAVHFLYADAATPLPEPSLKSGSTVNEDYWYCGSSSLKPVAATDDGIHTRFTFTPRTELPAVFVKTDDGIESLINFHVEHGDVVIHRVARKFVLRRGQLVGCVENRSLDQRGVALRSGTVSTDAVRETMQAGP